MAADFYVSAGGDDHANGRSPQQAWRSAERAAQHLDSVGLQPGDRLLFAGGEDHALSRSLVIDGLRSHGTSEAPITIASYGDGRARLRAEQCTAIAITLSPESVGLEVIVAELELQGDLAPTSEGKPAHGLQGWFDARQRLNGLHLRHLLISNFAGDGITICRSLTCPRVTDVVIEEVISQDNPGCAGWKPHSGSGIVVGGVAGARIEHCIARRNGERNDHSGGPVGIWYWDAVDSSIRHCRSTDNRTIRGDGGGFDLDGGCQRCVIENCVSQRNAGAGYLFAQFDGAHAYGPLADNIIRGNISVDDGRQGGMGGIHSWGASAIDCVGANLVHHNTIIMSGKPRAGAPACVVLHGPHTQGLRLVANRLIAMDELALFHADHPNGADLILLGNAVGWSGPAAPPVQWGSQKIPESMAWMRHLDGALAVKLWAAGTAIREEITWPDAQAWSIPLPAAVAVGDLGVDALAQPFGDPTFYAGAVAPP